MWEKERVAECKPKNKKRGRLGMRSYIAVHCKHKSHWVSQSNFYKLMCQILICGCYAAYTDMPHKSTYAHPTIYLLCIRLVLLAAISRMEKCANNVNTVHARTLEHGYLVPTFCSWYIKGCWLSLRIQSSPLTSLHNFVSLNLNFSDGVAARAVGSGGVWGAKSGRKCKAALLVQ